MPERIFTGNQCFTIISITATARFWYISVRLWAKEFYRPLLLFAACYLLFSG
jgi:hypothetical protein